MSFIMAKVKKQPQPNRSGKNVNVWIDEPIGLQLDAYLRESDPRVSITSAVETALREFLRGKGYWPPPKGQVTTEPIDA